MTPPCGWGSGRYGSPMRRALYWKEPMRCGEVLAGDPSALWAVAKEAGDGPRALEAVSKVFLDRALWRYEGHGAY